MNYKLIFFTYIALLTVNIYPANYFQLVVNGVVALKSFAEQAYNYTTSIGKGQQALHTVDKVLEFGANITNTNATQAAITTLEDATKIHSCLTTMNGNILGIKGGVDIANANLDTMKNRLESVGQSVSTMERLCQFAAIVTMVKSAYDLGSYAKSYFWPSEEEKLRKLTAHRQLKILQTFDKLNECLVRNTQSAKDHEGLPHVCKEPAEFFASTAGYVELNKIKEQFRAATTH